MPLNELTVSSLVTDFRREVDDQLIADENDIAGTVDDEDNLFSTCQIHGFIEEAQRELASELDLIPDTRTLTITDGEALVRYDPRIYFVRRAIIPSLNRELDVLNMKQLQDHLCDDDYGHFHIRTDWESATGQPRALITDVDQDKFRIYPIPNDDFTATLYVYRYPLFDVDNSSASLEVKSNKYKRAYLTYMKYLAYSNQDTDLFDEGRADRFFAEYTNVHFPKLRLNNNKRTKNKMIRTGYGGL